MKFAAGRTIYAESESCKLFIIVGDSAEVIEEKYKELFNDQVLGFIKKSIQLNKRYSLEFTFKGTKGISHIQGNEESMNFIPYGYIDTDGNNGEELIKADVSSDDKNTIPNEGKNEN